MINYKKTVLPAVTIPIAGIVYNLFTDAQGLTQRGNLRGSDKITLIVTSSINLSAGSSIAVILKKNDGSVVQTKTIDLDPVTANTPYAVILDDEYVEAADYFLLTVTAESNASTYVLNVYVECSGGAGEAEVDWGTIGGTLSDQDDLHSALSAINSELDTKLNIVDAPNYSVATLDFYLNDGASGVSTYNVLGKIPDTVAEEIDSIVVNNNTVLIESYVTDVLGITSLKAGAYKYHFWRSVSVSAGVSKLEFKWYSRAENGDETLLYTHESSEINDTSLTYNETLVTEATPKTILATDRIVLKVYAKTTHTSNVTVSFSHSGSLRNSHIETPIDAPISSALTAALALKHDKALTGQTAPVSETRATATYTGAANAGFILYSKLLGTASNAITYVITTAADDNLAISITGNAITIALANTTASKNTATLVKAAIEAKAEANALVAVVLTGTGAGVVATQSVASLTGGLNGTTGYQGQVIFDSNKTRWEMIWTNGTVYYWAPPADCYPDTTVEYVVGYDHVLGKIIYKKRLSGTTVASGTKTTVAHGILLFDQMISMNNKITTGVPSQVNNFYLNDSSYFFCDITSANISAYHPNAASFLGRPFVSKVMYTKSV